MDNLEFCVKGRAEEQFKQAMNLLLDLHGDKSHEVNAYGVLNGTLYLFRIYDRKSQEKAYIQDEDFKRTEFVLDKMPYKMKTREILIAYVWAWLSSLDKDERNKESFYDDGDVSNVPAWKIYVDTWGHVANRHDGVMAVEASWAWLGK
jgi:hypothetical protein